MRGRGQNSERHLEQLGWKLGSDEMTDGHNIELADGHKSWNDRIGDKWNPAHDDGLPQKRRQRLEQQKLVQEFDPEQDDGLSQKLEQKLGPELVQKIRSRTS